VAGARRFQDLICYQLANQLRTRIADLAESTGIARDRDLADQLRRAARSVTGNIAEGFPSRSHAEFARFLTISKRSLCEIEDRVIEAAERRLVSDQQAAEIFNSIKRTSVAVSRLTNYLRKTPEPPR
jgi:four helix bundle protein